MKKNWKLILGITLGVLSFVGLLFLPYVISQETSKNAIETLFNGTFAWISVFIYLPFVLFIAGILFLMLRKKIKHGVAAAFIFFMISGFLFIFSNSFVAFAEGLKEEDVRAHAGSIIFGIVSFIFALVANSFVLDENKFSVRDIVESAMLVSFAVILDLPFLKFKIVPNGGSISLAMFPLLVVALRQGPVKGFIVSGIVFGFVTCLMDGYGLVYFPFDYLLGFGAIGIIGLFRKFIFPPNKIGYTVKGILFLVIALLVVGVGRTLASTISGMLFYEFSFVDSLVYQLLYIPASIGLCLVAIIALFVPLQIINKRYPLKVGL